MCPPFRSLLRHSFASSPSTIHLPPPFIDASPSLLSFSYSLSPLLLHHHSPPIYFSIWSSSSSLLLLGPFRCVSSQSCSSHCLKSFGSLRQSICSVAYKHHLQFPDILFRVFILRVSLFLASKSNALL